MDVATLIGLATGIGLVIYSITAKGGTGEYFWNLPALALLTTFYGLLLANLLFIPIGGKLKRRSDEEIMMKEFMIEGILCLHNRDHPLIVREKLNTFVPRSERKNDIDKKKKK